MLIFSYCAAHCNNMIVCADKGCNVTKYIINWQDTRLFVHCKYETVTILVFSRVILPAAL